MHTYKASLIRIYIFLTYYPEDQEFENNGLNTYLFDHKILKLYLQGCEIYDCVTIYYCKNLKKFFIAKGTS